MIFVGESVIVPAHYPAAVALSPPIETYVEDADREGDSELADFFRRAQETSRKGAEQGKEMLRKRLAG